MITEKGFIMPTLEEIFNKKLEDFKTVKPDMRVTDSNLIIPLLKFDAVEEYDTYLKALAIYNNLNVYTAVGASLNNITSHLNLTWEKAKYAKGKIKIKGQNGTKIPQAFGVETQAGVKFVTVNVEEKIISKGEIELDVIALNPGKEGNVNVRSINKITNAIAGITEIFNEHKTYGGQDYETDTELRERYLKRIQEKSAFTTEGIKQYILKNTNVIKCQVIENDTDEIEEGRLPHSYEAVCLGDTDDNILQALYDYKLAGIRTVGDIKKTFKDISVGFSRPIEIELNIEIKLTIDRENWKSEFVDIIKDIVSECIDTVEPNGIIYSYKMLGKIYQKTAGIKSIDIKMNKNGTSNKVTDYALEEKEIAVVNNVTVSVL